MTIPEARDLLTRFNAWRRGDGPNEPYPGSAKTIGEAIDVLLAATADHVGDVNKMVPA